LRSHIKSMDETMQEQRKEMAEYYLSINIRKIRDHMVRYKAKDENADTNPQNYDIFDQKVRGNNHL